MGSLFESLVVGEGTRLQSGIPKRFKDGMIAPNGMLLRGGVLATYVLDDPDHPYADDPTNPPVAVYCDVLTYANINGYQWFVFKKVLVSSRRGGLHSDEVWKPRASKINIRQDLDRTIGSNLANFDGDHVLLGFMNNTFDQPIILRGLPHSSRDTGNDNFDVGKRAKLQLVDGSPVMDKHNGVFYGVDDSGNFSVDSTFANDGTIDAEGNEPDPDTSGTSGNQAYNLPVDSNWKVVLYDMSDPESPTEISSMQFQKDKLRIQIDEGEGITIENKDGDAKITLGDGAVKAAIADHLETFYNTEIKVEFLKHKHPTGTGPSGIPDTPLPDWDANINSQKLTFPDN